VINLIHADVGRPVGQLVVHLVGVRPSRGGHAGSVDTLAPKEVEVQTKAGAWFLLRIRPYRTLDHVIEGAVITFTEITGDEARSASPTGIRGLASPRRRGA